MCTAELYSPRHAQGDRPGKMQPEQRAFFFPPNVTMNAIPCCWLLQRGREMLRPPHSAVIHRVMIENGKNKGKNPQNACNGCLEELPPTHV